MNQRLSYVVVAIGIVFTAVYPSAFAKNAKAGKSGSEMKLVSIDVTNNNITVSDPTGKNISTFAVTELTTVTINGQPAKLSDLRRKMRVMLSVSHEGKTADKIDATDPPKKKSN